MHFYLVDLRQPARKIQACDLPIFVGPRCVWAVLPNGRRKLLGASAFFTRASAVRCQLAILQKLLKNDYANKHNPARVAFYTKRIAEITTLH